MQVFGTLIIFGLVLLIISPIVVLTGGIGSGWRALNRLIGGVAMLVVSIGIFANIMFAYTGGKHTVTAQLEAKWLQSCGKRSTCCDIMLHTGQRFELPQPVYMQLQLGGCYRMTYYHGVFNTTDGFVASVAREQPGLCRT